MFGWKAKATIEETPTETEALIEEDLPTWADGSLGPSNSVSRIYGPSRSDAEHEARLAMAE